jgi:hypothetical protein
MSVISTTEEKLIADLALKQQLTDHPAHTGKLRN